MRRLQAAAHRFADGDLTVEPEPADGPPEVRALPDAIATMAIRLDTLLAAQRDRAGPRIVDGLAEASGGHIERTDAPGGGLTVAVSIPVAPTRPIQ